MEDERTLLDTIVMSIVMAGAFIFIWLNLASGPVIGIALGATLLHMFAP